MNYYIQGDAANADQIKAAFEKLGYDTTGHLFSAKSVLYFTLDGGIRATTCNCTPAIIKTHPDYKELELPVEPKSKFKVGDWIAGIDDEGDVATEKIVCFMRNKVLLVDIDGCFTEYPKTELNNFHLWTIADAKDGDVLAADECYVIFKEVDGLNIKCYCTYNYIGFNPIFYIDTLQNKTAFRPATQEQREWFFKKMKEAGYQWDSEKKELEKIKSHYNIENFHAGMPVLVRADDNCKWDYSVFSRITGNVDWNFAVCNGVSVTQCIPFEGNEHLLGTTDMCDEMYINW